MSDMKFTDVWSRLIVESWSDDELRQRMRDDPAGVLAERGANVPDGTKLVVHADEGDVVNLPLPRKPPSEVLDLADEPHALTYYIF